MEIHLIRHTKVVIPDEVCFGQTDAALRKEWKEDMADITLDDDYDRVFSSPLSRCTQLAEFFELNYEVENRLIEMSFGEWELQKWIDIPEDQIQPWYTDFIHTVPPQGENLLIMKERISNFLDELLLKHADEKLLIITHSGVIRVFMHLIMEFPLENMFRIVPQHGKKMIIKRDYGVWKWTGMNW